MMKGPRVREKDYQKLEIFQAIASDEQLSRKDIIHKLSLRSSTVSAAVSELLSDGLVLEAEKKDSGTWPTRIWLDPSISEICCHLCSYVWS